MNTEAMTVCGWMAAVGLGLGGFHQGAFDKFFWGDAAGKLERVSNGAMVDDGMAGHRTVVCQTRRAKRRDIRRWNIRVHERRHVECQTRNGACGTGCVSSVVQMKSGRCCLSGYDKPERGKSFQWFAVGHVKK